jgi:hypothetical protein
MEKAAVVYKAAEDKALYQQFLAAFETWSQGSQAVTKSAANSHTPWRRPDVGGARAPFR